MRKLSDTFIFQEVNKTTHIYDNLKNINFKFDLIDPSKLEDQLRIINRRFNYGLKQASIEAVNNGEILFIYPENSKLTKLMPIYLANVENKVCAVINLKLYATKDRMDNISIDPRTLFALIQAAYLHLQCQVNWKQLFMNTSIMKTSAMIYVKMFNKVLDKMFGINLNTIKSDKINYLIAKFFLIYIFGKEENDVTNNIALGCVFNKTDPNVIQSIEADSSSLECYNSLEMLIILLSKQEGLSKLNIRSFLENWFLMFGESTAFAMEYLPSLYEAVFSAMLSARINRDNMFEHLLANETASLYSELTRILR